MNAPATPVLADKPVLIHLTTADISLAVLLAVELRAEVEAGYSVIGMSAPGPRVAEVEALGVTHVEVPAFTRSWNIRQDLTATWQIYRSFKKLKPAVVHTHTPKAGVIGRVTARLAGVPIVVNTVHGLWANEGDPLKKRMFVLGMEALAARFSDAELFQNPEDARTMNRWLFGRLSKVVGNGTDLTRFVFDAAGRSSVRKEWGVDDDELLIVGVGRLVAEKGILDLDTAVQLVLSKTSRRVRFVWVGPKEPSKVDQVDTVKNFTLAGERHDMPQIYSAADVFVLPSHREGFPRSAMEAASIGLPLVLTDIRGCREIGTPEKDALFVPPSDPEALANALVRIIESDELRRDLARSAKSRAASTFDQRVVAGKSMSTYKEVAARTRRASKWKDRLPPR